VEIYEWENVALTCLPFSASKFVTAIGFVAILPFEIQLVVYSRCTTVQESKPELSKKIADLAAINYRVGYSLSA
jgi:hypothetical protein